jgi:tetratricopeptide (TPR) repeat protein
MRAIPLLQRILKFSPNDSTAHEMLGVLDKHTGACADAIEQFEASAALIYKHPESLEAYASCLFAESRFKEDIPVLQQLVALLPSRTYPKYDLAVVLVRTKQYTEALQVLEPLLPEDMSRATDADLLSVASEAYEQTGNTPKAAALLREAIVLDPTNPSYFTQFADLCLTHESYDVGIAMLNAGIVHMPSEASLYLVRGLLYAKTGEIDKAKSDFKRAEQLDSTQSLSAYATDLAELESNHRDIALANIRTQLKTYPDSPLLHYTLAKILDTLGTEDGDNGASGEALRSALEAARLKPDMVEAHNLLGSIYARTSQYYKAIEECRLVLRLAPSDQSAMYHLLMALRHEKSAEHTEEINSLATQLAEIHRSGLKEEADRKRFKLVEEQAPIADHPTPR